MDEFGCTALHRAADEGSAKEAGGADSKDFAAQECAGTVQGFQGRLADSRAAEVRAFAVKWEFLKI